MRWLTVLLALVALVVLALPACGFHLRGALPGAGSQVPALVLVSGDNPYGDLIRELNRVLELAGLQEEQAAGGRRLTLEVLDEQHSRRVVSRSVNLGVAEHELRASVSYLVVRGEEMLLAPVRAEVERVYQFDPAVLAGNSEQEDRLRAEMRGELAGVILLRISALLRQLGDAGE